MNLDLPTLARALPIGEWLPESDAIDRIARVSKVPKHDRSLARGFLSSLLVFGLVESTGGRVRRTDPAEQERQALERKRAERLVPPTFHPDPLVVGGPQVVQLPPRPFNPA